MKCRVHYEKDGRNLFFDIDECAAGICHEKGLVIEYTSETRHEGKFRRNDAMISGLKVMYRMWESAEGLGVEERYGLLCKHGKWVPVFALLFTEM